MKNLGVLTSGGDAPGMNAAVRAVVRSALDRGLDVYAIYEGYQGIVEGGDGIRKMTWDSVSGILHRGGTIIGTARCQAFRTREGRLQAAQNLLAHHIDRLVVIGGDGSLTGAHVFRQEWPELLAELVANGRIDKALAEAHPQLTIVGLVGSIDNDMAGTDMTIGADTALNRIVEAVDALSSTAASHQRTFVVEVMGRHCGYLALMSAIATGADWVLIPENPPEDGWETTMCEALKAARQAGRRESIVIVSEGACDRHGNAISSHYVREVLETHLGQDARVTILGHVQRGGSPSAFDRYMSTVLGYHAVEQILSPESAGGESYLIGMRENRVRPVPLMASVAETQAVAEAIAQRDYDRAVTLRGGSFRENLGIFETLARARPKPPAEGQKRLRIAILNASAPAPGMNTATRAAVRLALDKGHRVIGVRHGFEGLINGAFEELDWMSVEGWVWPGGSELGTNRKVPAGKELYAIARNLEEEAIDALLVIGGWTGYESVYTLYRHREQYPAFAIPMICLPASINNNLPGSEFSIGADTALNSIVMVVDKIKQSAVATRRAFVVEVMGRYCGYLALLSGLATGAERVYLHEEGVTLRDLQEDVNNLITGFRQGKRLGLMIRNENANAVYSTGFMHALFEEEGGDLFSVRQAILGHLQQGGNPSPFDRIQATRLAARCVNFLIEKATQNEPEAAFIGLERGKVRIHDMENFPRMVDAKLQRPKEQWWLALRPIARIMAQPGPSRPPAAAEAPTREP